VGELAQRLIGWFALPEEVRTQAREGLVGTVRELWSWEGVARVVIAAAEGRLEALPRP
jgi:hypothetical protein